MRVRIAAKTIGACVLVAAVAASGAAQDTVTILRKEFEGLRARVAELEKAAKARPPQQQAPDYGDLKARVLALEPEVLVLDEPCSGLDPISTAKIEDAMAELKAKYTIILVTNNTKQAARASDRTAFLLMGELIEVGITTQIFTHPVDQRTNDYLTGQFG